MLKEQTSYFSWSHCSSSSTHFPSICGGEEMRRAAKPLLCFPSLLKVWSTSFCCYIEGKRKQVIFVLQNGFLFGQSLYIQAHTTKQTTMHVFRWAWRVNLFEAMRLCGHNRVFYSSWCDLNMYYTGYRWFVMMTAVSAVLLMCSLALSAWCLRALPVCKYSVMLSFMIDLVTSLEKKRKKHCLTYDAGGPFWNHILLMRLPCLLLNMYDWKLLDHENVLLVI